MLQQWESAVFFQNFLISFDFFLWPFFFLFLQQALRHPELMSFVLLFALLQQFFERLLFS